MGYTIKKNHLTCQSKKDLMKYNSVSHAIGNTPLVEILTDAPARIYAKLEFLSPGGSIKDRSALYMIEDAEKCGLLQAGGTIIEASSGNQGASIAMIGAAKGYTVIITVPEKISAEKLATLKAYGAHVIICPATDSLAHPESYHAKAQKIHTNTPNSFMPNQYFNTKNAEAHYHSLGPEVWQQTKGHFTHFFAAAGTCGHVSGAGKYFKEQNSTIKVIALDAATSWRSTNGQPKPYQLEGIGIDFASPNFNSQAVDEIIPITDADALHALQYLAQHHGLLVGPSSGAVFHGAYEYAKKLSPDNTLILIFGDSGRAYLSKGFYTTEKTTHVKQENITTLSKGALNGDYPY